ncbi:molybdate ABC transporter substrate-binding protein [Methanolacinia paynteri]|uniref:molybdate ABC transporter substrate-binding protein n=1 Tax=Methanolacinia paynteri TaxID=230356 RepID=UPI001FDF0AF9|nr:molybdate ABC transporter substrate-binding protein [Methanolacinia paynteri]
MMDSNGKLKIILPLLLIVSAILFAGCTGTTDSPATATPTQTAVATSTATATATTAQPVTLTVFTAASLTGAFTDIADAYNAQSDGITVQNVFDGSQALRTQIEQGAEPDVFVSANTKHMNALVDEGYMDNDTVQLFLENSMAVIVPADNPANIKTLADLANPGVKIVIGTKDVPFGSYTRQVLEKMNASESYGPEYVDAVYANVVSEETAVSTVVPKLTLGEADAAFVYKSDILQEYKDQLITIEIPAEFNVVAQYPLGVLASTENKDDALDFIEFVRGPEGSAILEDYGFDPIPESQ